MPVSGRTDGSEIDDAASHHGRSLVPPRVESPEPMPWEFFVFVFVEFLLTSYGCLAPFAGWSLGSKTSGFQNQPQTHGLSSASEPAATGSTDSRTPIRSAVAPWMSASAITQEIQGLGGERQSTDRGNSSC